MWLKLVTLASVAVQLAAAARALSLIKLTEKKIAWILVSAGLAGMTLRRLYMFFLEFASIRTEQGDLAFELLGLFTSVAMLGGILLIGPIIQSIHNQRDEKERLANSLQEKIDQIRVLQNLLPICASCKKIRNDDGYWEQLESYISSHCDTQFSHGICPTCAEKLYGDYLRDFAKKGHDAA